MLYMHYSILRNKVKYSRKQRSVLCATSSSPGGRSGKGVGMKSQHVATDANRRERKGKKRPHNAI